MTHGAESTREPTAATQRTEPSRHISWRTKLGLLGGSLLAALVCLELILRVVSAARQMMEIPSTVLAASTIPTDGEFRVLCFGESMTEGFGETAYSDFLQRQLDAAETPRRFRVINAGFVSAHTPFLVSRLDQLLDEHAPHMVIAMMGINDELYFTDISSLTLPTDLQLLLLELKSYRLLKMIWFHLFQSPERGSRATPDIDPDYQPAVDPLYQRAIQRAELYSIAGQAAEAHLILVEQIELLRAESGSGARAAQIAPERIHTYYTCFSFLLTNALRSGRLEEALAFFESTVAIHGETEFFCRGLATLHRRLGNEDLAEGYLRRAEETANRNMLDVTKESFGRTLEILRSRDVAFVAVQYPLRPVSTLQRLLDGDESAIYVDLERPFRDALEKQDYSELFLDRFAGDFGHCTARGNQLIAESLMETVFVPLFALE